MRLLIAEDERDLAEALSVFFEKNQFTVDTVYNGFDAYEYAITGDYDAIVLDVMMPKLNGVEVLERLRAEGVRTPVMMLTAKAEKDDRITGFNAGADDYLPKPFAPDELICRVRAMLRRGGEYRPTVLTFGDVGLDCSTGMLSCAGQSVRLSGREFQVMELFLRAPKVVLSAERILERVWGWDSDAEINVVWVHISNLRKKLKGIGSTVTIRANRGLVNELVTLSRMDEEASPLQMADFQVSDALAETAESFRDFAASAGHTLDVRVTPGLTYCGDEYAIRQLVSILLDNAVKYAAPGTPIVFSLAKGRRGVVIRTENQCDELDTAALGRLFDRFYRADPARSAETGGFGIGLSIARSIAEGHRGTIRAESPDGRTIVFTAELK